MTMALILLLLFFYVNSVQCGFPLSILMSILNVIFILLSVFSLITAFINCYIEMNSIMASRYNILSILKYEKL